MALAKCRQADGASRIRLSRTLPALCRNEPPLMENSAPKGHVMAKDPLHAWWSSGIDLWKLGLDAGTVMTLRAAKIATGGPAALAEVNLMVDEKVDAAVQAQIGFITGSFGTTPAAISKKLVRYYGAKVRANKRRLKN